MVKQTSQLLTVSVVWRLVLLTMSAGHLAASLPHAGQHIVIITVIERTDVLTGKMPFTHGLTVTSMNFIGPGQCACPHLSSANG